MGNLQKRKQLYTVGENRKWKWCPLCSIPWHQQQQMGCERTFFQGSYIFINFFLILFYLVYRNILYINVTFTFILSNISYAYKEVIPSDLRRLPSRLKSHCPCFENPACLWSLGLSGCNLAPLLPEIYCDSKYKASIQLTFSRQYRPHDKKYLCQQ